MKDQLFIKLLFIISIFLPQETISQCINIFNGPFPLLELEQFNCSTGICDAPIMIQAPWSPGDTWQLPTLIPGAQYMVDFALDPAAEAQFVFMEMTLFDNQPIPNVIACTPGLQMQFTIPPGPGTYFLTISQFGFCGSPPTLGPFNDFAVNVACCSLVAACNPLTRQQAFDALIAPSSGFAMDPLTENLWGPFHDFGFGLGYEGMLPAQSVFGPATDLYPDFVLPPQPQTMDSWEYLFFLDLFPGALFSHDVAYVTVDALNPSPTLGNGGIQIVEGDWWPYTKLENLTGLEHYNSSDLFFTDVPGGPLNPDGLLLGNHIINIDNTDCPDPRAELPDKNNNKCAIVFAGGQEKRLQNSVWKEVQRLVEEDCYDKDGIIVVNEGNAGTTKALCDSIDAMLARNPACEEICIFITAHGHKTGGFKTDGGWMVPGAWASKMRKVGAKGVKIHITIETCYAEALGNPYTWGLPEGSTVIFASDKNHISYSGTVTAPNGNKVNEDLLSHAINQCRNDITDANNDGFPDADLDKSGDVSKKEGLKWVIKTKPCYSVDDIRVYPAGPPKDSIGKDPMPKAICIGSSALSVSREYKMPKDENCKKVCLLFKGDVTNGIGLAYDSIGFNLILGITLEKNLVMIDGVQHTEICFVWNPRFKDCNWYWFHYYTTDGKKLEQVKAYVKECAPAFKEDNTSQKSFAASSTDLPSTNALVDLSVDGSEMNVTIVNRDEASGGNGEDITITVGYRVSNQPVNQEKINSGHPEYSSLPLVNVVTDSTIKVNELFNFAVQLPVALLPGQILLVEVENKWAANSNVSTYVDQFEPAGVGICLGDVTYSMAANVPDLSNTNGTITIDGITLENGIVAFNAKNGTVFNPGTTFLSGKIALFIAAGCD